MSPFCHMAPDPFFAITTNWVATVVFSQILRTLRFQLDCLYCWYLPSDYLREK